MLPCAVIGSKEEKQAIMSRGRGKSMLIYPEGPCWSESVPAAGKEQCRRSARWSNRSAEVKGSFGHEGTPSRRGGCR